MADARRRRLQRRPHQAQAAIREDVRQGVTTFPLALRRKVVCFSQETADAWGWESRVALVGPSVTVLGWAGTPQIGWVLDRYATEGGRTYGKLRNLARGQPINLIEALQAAQARNLPDL